LTTLFYRNHIKAVASQEKSLSIHLLDEDTATLHFSLIFSRFKPLNRIFTGKVDQLISSGIVQKLQKDDSTSIFTRHQSQNEKKAQKLTMDHIGVCFAAILSCLGLSLVVFLIELLSKYFV
jgi:hypothetical protein